MIRGVCEEIMEFLVTLRCNARPGESIGSMTILVALFVSLLQAFIVYLISRALSLLISLYLPFRSGYFRTRAIDVDLMSFLDDVIYLFQSYLGGSLILVLFPLRCEIESLSSCNFLPTSDIIDISSLARFLSAL